MAAAAKAQNNSCFLPAKRNPYDCQLGPLRCCAGRRGAFYWCGSRGRLSRTPRRTWSRAVQKARAAAGGCAGSHPRRRAAARARWTGASVAGAGAGPRRLAGGCPARCRGGACPAGSPRSGACAGPPNCTESLRPGLLGRRTPQRPAPPGPQLAAPPRPQRRRPRPRSEGGWPLWPPPSSADPAPLPVGMRCCGSAQTPCQDLQRAHQKKLCGGAGISRPSCRRSPPRRYDRRDS